MANNIWITRNTAEVAIKVQSYFDDDRECLSITVLLNKINFLKILVEFSLINETNFGNDPFRSCKSKIKNTS